MRRIKKKPREGLCLFPRTTPNVVQTRFNSYDARRQHYYMVSVRSISGCPVPHFLALQRQHPSGGLVGRTVLGLERCGKAESIRNRPTQLDPWQVSPK